MANGTYGLNAIKTAINNKSTSAIKSVQRGVTSIGNSEGTEPFSRTVTISTVTPSKSIVLLEGSSAYYAYSGARGMYQPYVTALTANSFTVKTYSQKAPGGGILEFSWCVVEFN